jgi:hypothetical protein
MRPSSGTEVTSQLWAAVCRARGTPPPDPGEVSGFLRQLGEVPLATLRDTLNACLLGREQGADLDLVSWAAKCTRPSYLASLQRQQLSCSGSTLFSAGLFLMQLGWDMSRRIAQISDQPDDVVQLRAAILNAGGPFASPQVEQTAMIVIEPKKTDVEVVAQTGWDASLSASPLTIAMRKAMPRTQAPQEGTEQRPVDSLPAEPLPFERQPAEAQPSFPRTKLKLYGRDAAHTLESGPHKRSADFLGVHVVTIESARALAGGTYDWEQKLLLQLTPEEMPAVLAVLMGLSPQVRLDHHGTHRNKFVEIRRQKGGLVVVTGQTGFQFAVPVKPPLIYYMLDLFCRAMTHGDARRSVADVLALARSTDSE